MMDSVMVVNAVKMVEIAGFLLVIDLLKSVEIVVKFVEDTGAAVELTVVGLITYADALFFGLLISLLITLVGPTKPVEVADLILLLGLLVKCGEVVSISSKLNILKTVEVVEVVGLSQVNLTKSVEVVECTSAAGLATNVEVAVFILMVDLDKFEFVKFVKVASFSLTIYCNRSRDVCWLGLSVQVELGNFIRVVGFKSVVEFVKFVVAEAKFVAVAASTSVLELVTLE